MAYGDSIQDLKLKLNFSSYGSLERFIERKIIEVVVGGVKIPMQIIKDETYGPKLCLENEDTGLLKIGSKNLKNLYLRETGNSVGVELS